MIKVTLDNTKKTSTTAKLNSKEVSIPVKKTPIKKTPVESFDEDNFTSPDVSFKGSRFYSTKETMSSLVAALSEEFVVLRHVMADDETSKLIKERGLKTVGALIAEYKANKLSSFDHLINTLKFKAKELDDANRGSHREASILLFRKSKDYIPDGIIPRIIIGKDESIIVQSSSSKVEIPKFADEFKELVDALQTIELANDKELIPKLISARKEVVRFAEAIFAQIEKEAEKMLRVPDNAPNIFASGGVF